MSGDRVYQDEDGYFWFVGRDDDVIISSGYRIGPFEVESALLEHDAVVESAVVSSPDSSRGEVINTKIMIFTCLYTRTVSFNFVMLKLNSAGFSWLYV